MFFHFDMEMSSFYSKLVLLPGFFGLFLITRMSSRRSDTSQINIWFI